MLLRVVGNSHVWTVVGWTQFAARDSTVLDAPEESDGLRVRGFAVTGGTAHNLRELTSSTMAGPSIKKFLLGCEPGPTLVVFGDVDIRFHIQSRLAMSETLYRYCEYLRDLKREKLVDHLIVSSITGAHCVLQNNVPMVELWNDMLMGACKAEGWDYVDLYSPFVGVDATDGNNHLGDDSREQMLNAVRELIRGRASSGSSNRET